MRIRIKSNGLDVTPDGRAEIERHLRIMLGARATLIETLDVKLAQSEYGTETACSLSIRTPEGIHSVVERASEQQEAIKWAIWRIQHLLDRRALRTHPTRDERPAVDRGS